MNLSREEKDWPKDGILKGLWGLKVAEMHNTSAHLSLKNLLSVLKRGWKGISPEEQGSRNMLQGKSQELPCASFPTQERLLSIEMVRGKVMQISRFLKYITYKAKWFYPKLHIVTFPEDTTGTAQNFHLGFLFFSVLSLWRTALSLACTANLSWFWQG